MLHFLRKFVIILLIIFNNRRRAGCHPRQMDAAGEYTVQQIHRRVRRVGVRRVSLGDLQLRAAAILWDDS